MKVIILSGGQGTRLWPLSRKNLPKQFLKLTDSEPLIESTYKRALQLAGGSDIVTITNADYYFYTKEICAKLSPELAKNIISEPVGRNTAPAIALSIQFLLDKLQAEPNEQVIVFPSDHIISPSDKFIKYIETARHVTAKDYLVTFGIKPTKPETGYGYIESEMQSAKSETLSVLSVIKFHEKPDMETAEKYLEENSKLKYYWNAGIFAFQINTFINELKVYQPEIYKIISEGYDTAVANFSNMPSISIDYALMEKSKKVAVIPMELSWSDVGSWDAFYDTREKNQNGNVLIGDAVSVDTKDSLIYSSKRLVTAVGIENIILVETDDAVLVFRRGNGQDVKKLTEKLKKAGREEVTERTEMYRPWGTYKTLEKSKRYKIKKIVVKPGETLSLQMHYHRTEHWVVIKGTAKVRLGERIYYVHEGESTFVPKSTLHRLANPGKIPLEIIEVQNGEYVGEDDIKRFEDKYGRG